MKNRDTISFRVTENTALDGIVSNLFYYGFIRDKKAFRYALDHTPDNVPGKENAIKVSADKTIDINANYHISENMSAWEIADILLNKPEYFPYDQYGYLFMP